MRFSQLVTVELAIYFSFWDVCILFCAYIDLAIIISLSVPLYIGKILMIYGNLSIPLFYKSTFRCVHLHLLPNTVLDILNCKFWCQIGNRWRNGSQKDRMGPSIYTLNALFCSILAVSLINLRSTSKLDYRMTVVSKKKIGLTGTLIKRSVLIIQVGHFLWEIWSHDCAQQ